jgi:hypothetical protein
MFDCHFVAIAAGHTFIQSLRRGRYQFGMKAAPKQRIADAFDEDIARCPAGKASAHVNKYAAGPHHPG